MNPVEKSLQNAFSRHRVVVWYDPAQEWQDDFESLALDEVEKVTVNNTEFAAKSRILIQEPKRKFLLYIRRRGHVTRRTGYWTWCWRNTNSAATTFRCICRRSSAAGV